MSKNLTLKYILILLLSTLFSASKVFSQSSTADCSTNAAQQVTLGTCATITASSTLGNPTLSDCSTSTSGEDGWVWFTAASATSTVSYTPTTTGRDVAIFVYATCGATTHFACANAFGSALTTESVTFATTAGTSYRVRIVRVNGTAGSTSGSICIKKGEDECAGAITLTAASDNTCTTVSGSSSNATESFASCSGTADDDVWYKFVATATSHQVTVARTSMSNPVFEVFSGTCGSLTSLECVNDFGNNTTEVRNVTGLTIGATYYIRVHSNGNASGNGGFTICVRCIAPANDDCQNAISLTVNTGETCVTSTNGTSVGASQTLAGCAGSAEDDVWYKFVATATSHKIELTETTLGDGVFEVFSGTCGSLNSMGCVDYWTGTSEYSVFHNLTIGATYFIRVYDFDLTGDGTFSLCVTTAFDPCSSIGTIASCGASTSATLAAGAGSFYTYPDFAWVDLGREALWSYTPNVSGSYVVDLTAISGGYFVDFFYRDGSSCGSDNWTYIDDMDAIGTTITFDLVAGTTYYIMVDDEDILESILTFEIKLANGASCNSVVSMTNTSMSVNENGGTFDITLEVSNPSLSTNLTVDLDVISGDVSRVNSFAGATITIPAGATTFNYSITLSDNVLCDDIATLVFELSNASGGVSAALGTQISTSVLVADEETEYQTLVSTGFETTDPAYTFDLSSTNPWAASTTNPISGLRSFVSGASASAGQNYFSTDLNRTYYAGMTSIWRFQINHFGNEPDNTTKWQVILSSDQKDLTSATLNGYAVGINPLTPIAADLVTLWKISNGAYTSIYTSSIDWGAGNTTAGFEIIRDENGLWTLKYDSNGGFDALVTLGTGTDETYSYASNYGVRYYYASGNGQKLAIDDMSFIQKGCAETIYSVGSGGLTGSVWSNSTSGAGSVKKPGRFTNVVIQTGHTITLDKTFVCDHLSSQGASTLDCGSYELVIHGNANLGGALAATNNKIVFKGDAAQTFSSASVLNVNNLNVYNTLEKNIGTALTLLSAVNLRGVLSAEKGMVNTNGYLTLISNATVTGSIGEINTDADVVGTITAQRYLPAALQNFVNLGSPITGLTLGDWNDDLVTTGFPGSDYPTYNFNSIYTYNEALAGDRNVGWVGSTSISNPLLTSKGYMVYMTGAANTLDATGAFQKGNVSIPLSLTNTSSTGDGWNLMLNPYPSEVDWNQVVANSAGVTTYYVYDSQSGSYKSYNGATSTGNASRYIPMGQSFFVGATLQGSSLNYTEAMKTATNAMLERSYVRPNGFVFELARGQFKEELMLLTSPEATADFEDSYDAYRLVGPVAEMHSLYSKSNDNEKLAVDVRQSWGENNIPLYVNAPTKGKYTLTVSALPMSSDITCWIIKDLVTGVELPLEVGMKINANIEANYEGVRWIIEPRSLVSFGSLQADNFTTDNGSIDVVSTNDSWNYTLVNELGTTVSSSASTSSYTGLAAGRYTVAFSSSTGCAAQQVEVVVGSGNLVSAEAIVAAQEAANESSSIVTDELNSIQLGTMSGAWMIQWKDNYEGKVVMTVYNSVGQMVMTESLDGSTRSHIIPNGKFSEGAYVIALSQDDKQLFSGSCLVIE
jgi:hypothetical protein